MRKPGWRIWLGSALLGAGAAALGWSAWVRIEASVSQKQARDWLSHAPVFRSPRAENATAASLRRGDPIGELEAPRLHLSVMVREGDDERTLRSGAGHIPGTALVPGKGNIGIAGHRDTFFRPLRFIRPDDRITLRTPAGIVQFTVSDVEIVPPDDVQALSPEPGRDLTLVTCYPFYYVGPAPKRFIVHAKLAS